MTPLEREYRFLIARAQRANDHKLARQLTEWGSRRYGLNLTDLAS